jgi:hypothetical protein
MKRFLIKVFTKEPVKRALRTFFQAAAGYISVNIAVAELDTKRAVIGFIGSAIAAGIAAVMNLHG